MRDRHEKREHGKLEGLLRRDRPAPRQDFLETMIARVESEPAPARRREPRFRFGLAVAFASIFLVAFASLGGLGYAKSGTFGAAKGTFSSVSDIFRSAPARTTHASTPAQASTEQSQSKAEQSQSKASSSRGEDDDSPGASDSEREMGDSDSLRAAHHQYVHFVVVCVRLPFNAHRTRTIVIPDFLVPLFRHWIVNFGPCRH